MVSRGGGPKAGTAVASALEHEPGGANFVSGPKRFEVELERSLHLAIDGEAPPGQVPLGGSPWNEAVITDEVPMVGCDVIVQQRDGSFDVHRPTIEHHETVFALDRRGVAFLGMGKR